MDTIYFLKRKGEKQDRQWKALMRGCRSRWRPALAYPWGALGYELQQLILEGNPSLSPGRHWLSSVPWSGDVTSSSRSGNSCLVEVNYLEKVLVHAIGNQHQHHRGDRHPSPSQRDLARTPPAFSTARNILSERDREFNRMD